jgi:hypothetical protein
MPPGRRIVLAAVMAMSLGLTAVVVLQGFSTQAPVKLLETGAVIVVFAGALGAGMIIIGLRMADWREPEDEAEFEQVVQRAERLAREGTYVEPDEGEFLDLDPYDDHDF